MKGLSLDVELKQTNVALAANSTVLVLTLGALAFHPWNGPLTFFSVFVTGLVSYGIALRLAIKQEMKRAKS